MTETACANGSSLDLFLNRAISLFLEADDFCRKFEHLLFVARDASRADVPLGVSTLSLCAALEGLLLLLAGRYLRGERLEAEHAFSARKKHFAALLDAEMAQARNGNDKIALKRFRGMVGASKYNRPGDLLRLLSDHFDLPWEGDMEDVLHAWKQKRNPLAHGQESGKLSSTDIFARSRIAGGFNVLAAAAIGYKGHIPLFYHEDRYIELK